MRTNWREACLAGWRRVEGEGGLGGKNKSKNNSRHFFKSVFFSLYVCLCVRVCFIAVMRKRSFADKEAAAAAAL